MYLCLRLQKKHLASSEQEIKRLKKEIRQLENTVRKMQSDKQDFTRKTVASRRNSLDSMDTVDSLMRHFVKQVFTTSPIAQYPIRLNMFNNSFDAYVVKVKKSDLRIFWNQPDTGLSYRNFYQLKHSAEKNYGKELIFATNGGMFTPSGSPQGLYVEDGKTLVPLDTISRRVGYLNFYLQPNGVFLLDDKGEARVYDNS